MVITSNEEDAYAIDLEDVIHEGAFLDVVQGDNLVGLKVWVNLVILIDLVYVVAINAIIVAIVTIIIVIAIIMLNMLSFLP